MPPHDRREDDLLLPVTALATHPSNSHILVGSGPDVQIYHEQENSLLGVHRLFEGQAIHGLLSNDHGVLAWGGRGLCWSENDAFESMRTVKAPDWILDATLSSDGVVYAVTAHNVLLKVTLGADKREPYQIASLTQPSHGLLMSAQIHGPDNNDESITIVSGSQFGEIIVWSYNSGVTQTFYVIRAHEGPVFGVDLSLGLLASCSDDRTVKVWNVSRRLASPTSGGTAQTAPVQLHQPVASAMRHESRVWRVRFLNRSNDGEGLHIVSAGEDATCRLWYLKSKTNPDLEQVAVHKDHDGKSVWSVTARSVGLDAADIVTGGAGGAVVRRRITFEADDERSDSFRIDLQSSIKPGEKDFVRSYSFLDHGSLLLTTDRGNSYVKGRGSEAHCLGNFRDIQRYSVVKSLPGGGTDCPFRWCFFAGTNGIIFFYDGASSRLSEIADVGAKVADLFPQVVLSPTGTASLYLLVTSLVPGKSKIFHFSLDEGKDQKPGLLDSCNFDTKGGIVTSTLITTNKAILGTRDGSLMLLNLNDTCSTHAIAWTHNSAEAITAIRQLWTNNSTFWLAATSRDGALRLYEVTTHDDAEWRITLSHALPLPFGPNIEGLHVTPTSEHIWACGFDKTDFVIYDVANDRRLLTTDCGGSHRHWDCRMSGEPSSDTFAASFACTRAGVVHGRFVQCVDYVVVKSGGHGREIKACAVRPAAGDSLVGDASAVIATGAEDTNVRLWKGRRYVATLRRHVTGIQQLRWSEDGSLLFSCGGLGELLVWRVRELPSLVLPIGVVFDSRCPLEADLLDLRVMSFDVTAFADSGSGPQAYLVSLGLSNSSVMHFRYEDDRTAVGRWSPLATAMYTSACLTQVSHLRFTDEVKVLTGSTDGHLVLWPSFRLQQDHNAGEQEGSGVSDDSNLRDMKLYLGHQSSVKTMACMEIAQHTYLIATGGDDNALTINLLHSEAAVAKQISMKRHRIARAHAAAITAIAMSRSSRSGGNELQVTVVTSGNDQRIKEWQVVMDMTSKTVLSIEKLSNVPTPVADVAGMVLLPRGKQVLLFGVGLQTYTLHD